MSPLNLVGDYGGGALYLAVGVLAAVIEARTSGKGQVVDAAMCDGVTNMLTMFHSMRAMGHWHEKPRTNLLDGGAHFYRTYQCKDGRYMAIGAIEPQFYAELRKLAGLDEPCFDNQMNREQWPDLQEKMAALFKTKTREEWTTILEGSDASRSAGCGNVRGAAASASRCTRNLRQRAWRRSARARTAVLPHAVGDPGITGDAACGSCGHSFAVV